MSAIKIIKGKATDAEIAAIEKALAHKDADAIRAIYNRGTYWAERVQMMQWWSDFLDTLKTGAVVLPFNTAAIT